MHLCRAQAALTSASGFGHRYFLQIPGPRLTSNPRFQQLTVFRRPNKKVIYGRTRGIYSGKVIKVHSHPIVATLKLHSHESFDDTHDFVRRIGYCRAAAEICAFLMPSTCVRAKSRFSQAMNQSQSTVAGVNAYTRSQLRLKTFFLYLCWHQTLRRPLLWNHMVDRSVIMIGIGL